MSNQLKIFFGFLLLSIMSFSSLTHANMEITAYGGKGFFHTNTETESPSPALNTVKDEGPAWIFGLDVVYRSITADSNCGIGIRYQHNFIKRAAHAQGQQLNFDSNRFAILGSYRFITPADDADTGLFLGVLGAWDIFRSTSIKVDAGSSRSEAAFEITNDQWFGLTGQVGLEVGYKWTSNFFIRGEVGYSLYGFSNLDCSDDDNRCGDLNNEKLGLSSVYGTLGIGWFFI